MARAPAAEDAHWLDEFLAGTGKRVGDLGRRRGRDLTTDNAGCFELTELSRQNFLADAGLADFSDKPSLAAALRGVESAYLVCSPIPQLVQLEGNAIEASEAAGVRQIVLNSALGAGDYGKSFPSWHRMVEDKLKATKIAHCIIRPNSFLQNALTYYAPGIRAQGAFYGAMRNARTSYLDVRDIATVAAKP